LKEETKNFLQKQIKEDFNIVRNSSKYQNTRNLINIKQRVETRQEKARSFFKNEE